MYYRDMVTKIALHKEKEISISFTKSSFLRFVHAMGMISDEAKKSATISWGQYKKGKSYILKDAKDLLS